MREFLKTVNFDVDERNVNGIVLSSLLRHLLCNSSVTKTAVVDLRNGDNNSNRVFEIDDFHIQMSRKRNEG